jgi:hypothetical protein
MAAPASVEVETWAEAITHFFRLVEVDPPIPEHFLLVSGQAGEHAACSRRSPPDTRVAGPSKLRRQVLSHSEQHDGYRREQDPHSHFAHFCSLRKMHGSHL